MKKRATVRYQKVTIAVMAALLFLYIVLIAVAPVRKLHELKKIACIDSVFYSMHQSVFVSRQLFNFSKTKVYNEAQLAMARKDTFGLVVNLRDSTMSIILKGLKVHSTKMTNFQTDRFYHGLNPMAYAKLFSAPLRVQNEFSSIVKEPVIILKAPKSPDEARANVHVPDSLIHDRAYVHMKLEHDFNLIILQDDRTTPAAKSVLRQFRKDKRQIRKQNIISNIIHPKEASYSPLMVVYADAGNIISYYRALPQNALVIISY